MPTGRFELIDWLAIGGYLVLAIALGTWLSRRASRSTKDFYLAGRRLPWWIAGTSMVATTFAADTPLVITGWVRSSGIHRNWLWWGMAMGGVLYFVLLAAYWRRLEVTTDAELIEHRYSGAPARLLRGLYGGYHAIVTNTLVLTWVLLAMIKLVKVSLGLEDGQYDLWITGGALVLALTYSILAGLWGVAVTDFFQFFLAMLGSVLLAWKSVEALGGLGPMREMFEIHGETAPEVFKIVPGPAVDSGWSSAAFWTQGFAGFLVYLGVQGWMNKNADGDGRVVQRFSASLDERHARKAALWYHLAHYCLRPWPWILVALASIFLIQQGELPTLADGSPDHESAYPLMMVQMLGPGLFGLLCASFLAAFMSTLDTHFNLSSAYMVNDLYRRFLVRDRGERHYVMVGRLCEVGIGVAAAVLATVMDSISELFELLLALLGGLGPALLLRWFWWRVNAWTEIAALATSTLATLVLRTLDPKLWPAAPFNGYQDGVAWDNPGQYLLIVGSSLVVMLTVTLLTPPVPDAHLRRFHDRVQPIGCWGRFRVGQQVHSARSAARAAVVGWLGGNLLTYGLLLGIGVWLLGGPIQLFALAAGVGFLLLVWSWDRSVPRIHGDAGRVHDPGPSQPGQG